MELYAVRERRGGPWNWALGLREQAGFDDARYMDGLVDAGFVLLGGPLEGDREVPVVQGGSCHVSSLCPRALGAARAGHLGAEAFDDLVCSVLGDLNELVVEIAALSRD